MDPRNLFFGFRLRLFLICQKVDLICGIGRFSIFFHLEQNSSIYSVLRNKIKNKVSFRQTVIIQFLSAGFSKF